MGISIVQVSDKYVGSAVDAPATFAMASTPAAGSTVLVCIGLYQGSDGAVTSVTVGGQAAVLDIARTSALTDASIWRIQSFAGANGTVSITDSNGFNLYLNAVAIEVTGLADDPLEGEASDGTTSTTTDPIVLSAGAAPSTYPALFLGVFGFTSSGTDNGVVTTQGTSLYVHQNSTDDLGGAAAYQIVDDPASGQLAWSRTNANGWQAVSAYYLAADGETGGYRARDLIALATNNSPVSVPLVDESAGAGDADKVPRLQADGKLHPSTYDAGPALSDDAPQPVGGTASAGTATEAARADHVHAQPQADPLDLVDRPSPGTPATDTVRIFGERLAGRMFPAFVGPAGRRAPVQPLLARKKVALFNPPGNSTTVQVFGMSPPNAVGTATSVGTDATNIHTAMKRLEYAVTSASTSAVAGIRNTNLVFFRGDNSVPYGGFNFVARFGPSRGVASNATRRFFAGFTSQNGAPSDANPTEGTVWANMLAVVADAGDTNFHFAHRAGTGAVTKIDTGIPKAYADSSEMFELAIFCASSGTPAVSFQLTRLSDGLTFSHTATTDLPAATQLLSWQIWTSVGGTSSVVGVAIPSIYVETDF